MRGSAMKRRTPVAVVLLILLGSMQVAKGDFFGNLLTAMAKQLFDPQGVSVSRALVDGEPTDVGDVKHGDVLSTSFQSDLDSAVEQAKQREAAASGSPATDLVPNYKDVEAILEKQLAEEVVDLESELAEEQDELEEVAGDVGGEEVVEEELAQEEDMAYEKVEERVEEEEELEEEFGAAQEMAEEVAESYGHDVEVVMSDQAGNEYEVDSNLAGNEAHKETGVDPEAAAEAAEIVEGLQDGDGVVDAASDPVANELFDRTLEEHELEDYEEEMEEIMGHREAEVVGEGQHEEMESPGKESGTVGVEDGEAVEESGKVVAAPDTSIEEGEREGREAEANVLVTESDLFHMEATEEHSSRVRFVVAATLAAKPDEPMKMTPTLEYNITAGIIRDIELAAGYFYDADDLWEPGYGVYFNKTMSRDYPTGYSALFTTEIIYPVNYNQEDIERFVQRLIRDPRGIFTTTQAMHPRLGVSVSQKIEYCSNDWTFWSFTTNSGSWALERQSTGQRQEHQCWYNAREPVVTDWNLKGMWLLIGAMLISGALAATLGAVVTRFCLSSRTDDGDDDLLPRHHRRYLIESRLKGRNPMSLAALRRKSEKLWRRNQYTPHADPCDLVNMEDKPLEKESSRSKLRELANEYATPTWHPHNIDLDEKYGKKFSKQTKFSWVGDYKTQYARRARAKAAALAAEKASKESSESETPDIPPWGLDDGGDSPLEIYGNTITKRITAVKQDL